MREILSYTSYFIVEVQIRNLMKPCLYFSVNNVDKSNLILNTNARIHNGFISIYFVSVQETACSIEIRKFPFDQQECDVVVLFQSQSSSEVCSAHFIVTLILHVWVSFLYFFQIEIRLLPDRPFVVDSALYNNPLWELKNASSKLDVATDDDYSFDRYIFSLTLKRRVSRHFIAFMSCVFTFYMIEVYSFDYF